MEIDTNLLAAFGLSTISVFLIIEQMLSEEPKLMFIIARPKDISPSRVSPLLAAQFHNQERGPQL